MTALRDRARGGEKFAPHIWVGWGNYEHRDARNATTFEQSVRYYRDVREQIRRVLACEIRDRIITYDLTPEPETVEAEKPPIPAAFIDAFK